MRAGPARLAGISLVCAGIPARRDGNFPYERNKRASPASRAEMLDTALGIQRQYGRNIVEDIIEDRKLSTKPAHYSDDCWRQRGHVFFY